MRAHRNLFEFARTQMGLIAFCSMIPSICRANPPVAEPISPTVNLAVTATAIASSERSESESASKSIDGVVSDDSRWMNAAKEEPHSIELNLSATFTIASTHIYSGWQDEGALQSFELQFWQEGKWKTIPGAKIEQDPPAKSALRVVFDKPITTSRIRLVSRNSQYVRLREFCLFGPHPSGSPPLWTEVRRGQGVAEVATDPNKHYVLVNQIGYNLHWDKRFTAPNSPDGSAFVVRSTSDGNVLYQGVVRNNIGDFTPFRNASDDELVIEVTGKDKALGISVPFRVSPYLLETTTLDPALRFMVDCRSVVGTHPSAYGGHPWRDGTYYSAEVPSLVLMYLANPAFFQHAAREIDYDRQRAMVLDPEFELVPCRLDKDALSAARRYFKELDPPVGDDVPDLIHLLHWGIGYFLMDPVNQCPSGDPRGEKLHAQTVEQFAYFLYGFPHYGQYFTDDFHRRAMDFAFDHWEEVGLYEVLTEIGEPKGRECPGHSIAPNLMMYEVAKRAGRPEAERFLAAATAQANWYVDSIDPDDPRIGRGQRMSEFKAVVGLFMFQRQYGKIAPKNLSSWLDRWVQTMIERSDNMYDFRKYDLEQWTLPPPWNDPGSVAGFPAVAVMAKQMTSDSDRRKRLAQLKASHLDALFGRNPVNAASPAKGSDAFPGIDRGWPKHFSGDTTARLELCRGSISSMPAHEHYPFTPNARFRHPEGWVAFNAALNVGLAFCCWDDTHFGITTLEGQFPKSIEQTQPLKLILSGPIGTRSGQLDKVNVNVKLDSTALRSILLEETDHNSNCFATEVSLEDLGAKGANRICISYGYELFSRQLLFVRTNENTWTVRQNGSDVVHPEN